MHLLILIEMSRFIHGHVCISFNREQKEYPDLIVVLVNEPRCSTFSHIVHEFNQYINITTSKLRIDIQSKSWRPAGAFIL